MKKNLKNSKDLLIYIKDVLDNAFIYTKGFTIYTEPLKYFRVIIKFYD